MSATLWWVIAGAFAVMLLLTATLVAERSPAPIKKPAVPPPEPPPEPEPVAIEPDDEHATQGPHTLIGRGQVDEGAFLLVRTPLWDYPFNQALFTQVFVDETGFMTRARYCVVDTAAFGRLDVGLQGETPVSIPVGIGNAVATFPTDPETTWTH